MKKPTLALLVVAAAMLAACEPSQSEIEKAMKDSIGSTNSAIAGLLGNGVRIEIRDVRKLGCVEQRRQLQVRRRMDRDPAGAGRLEEAGTLTFMKASDGWAVSE